MMVNGLRADLHEPDCPGMDEDGNWLGDCDCAASCNECREPVDNSDPHAGYGMCASCLHDALRSGWDPSGYDR